MESHLQHGITQCVFVTCHPTQVSVPHFNPSQTGWYLICLPLRDGRLSWTWCWL